MPKKLSAAEVKSLAQTCGIDTSAPDWLAKIVALIQMLLALLGQNQAQMKAALKARGCPDDHCDLMCDAIQHNLAAAQDCASCCCPPTP